MIIKGSGSTILVVEDNEALRLAVVRQLRELGYEVVEADSARPALRSLASDATVDLLLTDIVMPGGMDGRALAHAALILHPTLPIIFTSGIPAGATKFRSVACRKWGWRFWPNLCVAQNWPSTSAMRWKYMPKRH